MMFRIPRQRTSSFLFAFSGSASWLLASLLLCAHSAHSFEDELAFEEEMASDFGLDAPFMLQEEIPVVLTAARLKQPRAEVPASVTVINSEQIQAWGVRTLPELMRFVPGMFIGHGDDENNPSVIYHASTPNIMRRLQVLVDGRSVFKAAIASVVWDDIPVALEDIARIEVTRGPNAASYGANSYLGIINIVTKHPGDTLGTRVRYRSGNQGYDDSFVSYSGVRQDLSYRLTAQINADNGYDGRRAEDKDELRDSRRHGFVSAYLSQQLDQRSHLDFQASYKQGHTDIRQEDAYDTSYPDQETEQGHLWLKWSNEFNARHSSHLQAYWQIDSREQRAGACVPTVALDPDLFRLYQLNPELALGLFFSGFDAGLLSSASDAEQQLVNGIVQRAQGVNPYDEVCGVTERGRQEQRFDIEWQDTMQWSDRFRTVSGFSVRRDEVSSKTLFNGTARNDTYRLFANAEWRATDWLLFNAGGMYEIEEQNDNAFSPRLAANFLISPQQSLRAVYSTAVRSPDLLEQTPDYRVTVLGLGDNYLGVDSAPILVNQADTQRNLDHEKITSRELGYYGKVRDWEWDIKVYKDTLTQLISNPIALNTTVVTSDGEMEIDGAELQLRWQVTRRDWLRMIAAYVNPVYQAGDVTGLSDNEISSINKIELRASARDSLVATWGHQGDDWSITASHFWYDQYGDTNGDTDRRYRRYEVNARKQWQVSKYSPWLGVFWHHIVDDNPLVYPDQYYATTDLYFVQLGVNF
jgi:iron complex outermembrane receptor protein